MKTLCGKTTPVDAPVADDFGAEKTCESCLRSALVGTGLRWVKIRSWHVLK